MIINTENTQMSYEDIERAKQEAFDIAIGKIPAEHVEQDDTQKAMDTEHHDVEHAKDSSTDDTEQDYDDSQESYDDDDSISYSIEDTDSAESLPEVDSQSSESVKKQRTDYKGKYFAERAKTNLLATRIENLSAQYRQLKEAAQQQPAKQTEVKQQAHKELDKIDIEKLPKNVREFVEDFPGFLDAAQYIVDHKIGSTKDNLESEIASKVNPLHEQLKNMEMQRARAMVEQAHPDVKKILAGDDFAIWVGELNPIMRNMMMNIYHNGTIEETIHMLNEYKKARGISNAGNSRKSPRNVPNAHQNQNSPRREVRSDDSGRSADERSVDDRMVQKLKGALTVPSSKAPVNLEGKKPMTPEDAFYAAIKEEEGKTLKRFR